MGNISWTPWTSKQLQMELLLIFLPLIEFIWSSILCIIFSNRITEDINCSKENTDHRSLLFWINSITRTYPWVLSGRRCLFNREGGQFFSISNKRSRIFLRYAQQMLSVCLKHPFNFIDLPLCLFQNKLWFMKNSV